MAQSSMADEERKARNREYNRVYRERHREAIRVRGAKWQSGYRKRNPDKAKEAIVGWRLKNKEHILNYKRAWKAAHRTEETLAQQARHTKTRGKIIKEDIENWFTRICGICGLLIEDKFHIDHKTPLAKGGPHVVENLQLVHPLCNLKKKDKLDFRL